MVRIPEIQRTSLVRSQLCVTSHCVTYGPGNLRRILACVASNPVSSIAALLRYYSSTSSGLWCESYCEGGEEIQRCK
jgi:hypothetical protein